MRQTSPSGTRSGARRLARRAAFLIAFLGLGAAPAQAATALRFAPPVFADPIEPASGPLDLTAVSFGQRETQLELRLRTAKPWAIRELGPTGARRLCLELWRSDAAIGTLCLGSFKAVPSIFFSDARTGSDPAPKRVAGASVGQVDERTGLAYLSPALIGLTDGPLRWRALADWAGGTCTVTEPCRDVAPNAGTYGAESALVALPRCFGAASRDPRHACTNPLLARAVFPTPLDAQITPNAPCRRQPSVASVFPCAFGLPEPAAKATVALIGDSHAAHWRGAAEVVAQANRWRGLSITRSSCVFTLDATDRPPSTNRGCHRWVRDVRRWLRARPQITTVIVASHTVTDTPSRRRDYARTWASLPAHIRRIIVIRDTPEASDGEHACVSRAIARRQPAGLRCSRARSAALPADPEAAAARTTNQSRVHLVDLTPFLCGPRVCPAVIGGSLVRRDTEHMARGYSTSLGPYLRDAVDAALR